MADGKFIVFEGIDGSGTTTQTKAAVRWLESQGIDVVQTHEPTDLEVGRLIRKALSRRMPGCEGERLGPAFFALLFATDRMHHMSAVVIPALESGQWVVSDRCYLSSFAYQSIDYDLETVRTLNRAVRHADVTFLLDVDPAVAYDRLAPRTLFGEPQLEVFETPEMLGRIRPNYVRIADILASEGDRIVRIDASKSAEAVAEAVRRSLADLL